MNYLAKYGQAKTVYFDLFQVDGIDFEPAATFVAGDIKIMKDEGAEANTTNLPTDEGQGYSLVLTAAEITAAKVKIYIVDQTATKVWLDTSIDIETYGNASAEHAFDLDTANVTLASGTHTGAIIPTVNSVANAVVLPTIPTNWITSAGIAAAALNGKGNWNIGKTGYSLTQAFPTNFADLAITATAGFITLAPVTHTGAVIPTVSGVSGSVGSVAGNVSGSVGSVVGAVGSVTGNVAGNLVGSIGSLGATAKTDVNAEVVDALNVDTYAEPGQEAPPSTASLVAKIGFLYKEKINKTETSATEKRVFNAAGTVVDHKTAISDSGTVFTKAAYAAGP